jgi:hypothetical protein
MNKEKYNQIIDDAYENYKTENQKLADVIGHGFHGGRLTQDEFINKCKTDSYFSETWGLKIEERELSLEERCKLTEKTHNEWKESEFINVDGDLELKAIFDEYNIPTKLITLTYNDETLESYEN